MIFLPLMGTSFTNWYTDTYWHLVNDPLYICFWYQWCLHPSDSNSAQVSAILNTWAKVNFLGSLMLRFGPWEPSAFPSILATFTATTTGAEWIEIYWGHCQVSKADGGTAGKPNSSLLKIRFPKVGKSPDYHFGGGCVYGLSNHHLHHPGGWGIVCIEYDSHLQRWGFMVAPGVGPPLSQ